MPKNSAKKITTEGAEEKKIIQEKPKPNIKEIVNARYAHVGNAGKWVWPMVIIFMAIILAMWIWITKMQLANLSWQTTQEQLTAQLNQNWDKNFEKLRDQEIGVKKLSAAWGQIIASLSSSTVSSTVITTTTTSTTMITDATSTIISTSTTSTLN